MVLPADGAPLTAELIDVLYLCVEHDDDAERKSCLTPPGVERVVDFIVGRGYCLVCDGLVAIAMLPQDSDADDLVR